MTSLLTSLTPHAYKGWPIEWIRIN